MNGLRRLGLALGIMALGSAALGCGGEAPMAAKSPAGPAAEGGNYGGYPAQAAPPAPPPGASYDMRAGSGDAPKAQAQRREGPSSPPADRPGLGTEWGETRMSRISTVPFVRADMASPFATASLFYNDEEGARAMASSAGFRRTSSGTVTIANGLASIALRDEAGTWFSGFSAAGKSYVVGEAGRRYTIVVRNNTDFRLEVVLSVDGLDVLDGKPAAFNKRGYLVDPHNSLEVDGFRQSADTVAAFRFGSVRGSYAAQKHGDTRNVGVIGVALFNERGTNPWNAQEIQRRENANPFPGQYATPP